MHLTTKVAYGGTVCLDLVSRGSFVVAGQIFNLVPSNIYQPIFDKTFKKVLIRFLNRSPTYSNSQIITQSQPSQYFRNWLILAKQFFKLSDNAQQSYFLQSSGTKTSHT